MLRKLVEEVFHAARLAILVIGVAAPFWLVPPKKRGVQPEYILSTLILMLCYSHFFESYGSKAVMEDMSGAPPALTEVPGRHHGIAANCATKQVLQLAFSNSQKTGGMIDLLRKLLGRPRRQWQGSERFKLTSSGRDCY